MKGCYFDEEPECIGERTITKTKIHRRTDNDRTIATFTANGVIDALYATAQAGGYDGSR